jgi:hypothetical protein
VIVIDSDGAFPFQVDEEIEELQLVKDSDVERELNMSYLRGPAEGEESAGGGEDGLDILPVMGAPLFAVTIPIPFHSDIFGLADA